jgi:hypothetical protein
MDCLSLVIVAVVKCYRGDIAMISHGLATRKYKKIANDPGRDAEGCGTWR